MGCIYGLLRGILGVQTIAHIASKHLVSLSKPRGSKDSSNGVLGLKHYGGFPKVGVPFWGSP